MDAGLPPPRLPPAAERLLLPAAALLWIERAWPDHLKWPAVAWTVYVALSLMGIAPAIPGELRVALLFALALASASMLLTAFRDVAAPARGAVLRRIEAASGARRGSLALLDERAVDLADPVAARLWVRARSQAMPQRLRLGRPRLAFDDAERYGLLPLLAIALALGLLLAKDEWRDRLSAAFSPYAVSLADVRLSATIEPPAYAGEPARTLALGQGRRTIELLKGSRLTLRVEGPSGEWRLVGPGRLVQPLADGRVALRVSDAGRYELRYGRRQVAGLDLRFAADRVPQVRFEGNPEMAPTGAIRIAYRVADDHGTVALWVEVRNGTEVRRVTLDAAARNGTGSAFVDLTADPFAGELVDMRLVARDGAGQVGHSNAVRLRLPERSFRHPVARAVIAARRMLLRDPGTRAAVAQRLTAIAAQPQAFADDLGVFAGLRSATWRLAHDRDDPRGRSTARILWDVAVDLEDGGASRALDDVRQAMDELARRMGTADDEELARLADRLAAGMGDYLRRQIEAMMQQAEPGAAGAPDARSIDLSFLDAMLGDLRDRLAAGDQAGAQAALQNLRRLMEGLQFGGAGDPQAARRAQAAGQAAQAARDLEARERDLQSETIAESVRRAVSGRQGPMEAQAQRQDEIERAAQAVERQAAAAGLQPPKGMAEARKAMAEAQAALAAGRQGEAMMAQERAVSALGQAAEAMEGQARALAQAAGGAMAAQPGASGSGVDPLGRPGSGFGQGAVKLPDGDQMRRVQAIRRLLEERASDPARSAEERAYYLRLLKRF